MAKDELSQTAKEQKLNEELAKNPPAPGQFADTDAVAQLSGGYITTPEVAREVTDEEIKEAAHEETEDTTEDKSAVDKDAKKASKK